MFVMAVYHVKYFPQAHCTRRSLSFQFTMPIFYATVSEVDGCKGQLAHKNGNRDRPQQIVIYVDILQFM